MSGQGDPIFIGGIAGTGKTRLGSLLGHHPNVAVTRKTYLWRQFYARYGDMADRADRHRCAAAILASPGVERLHLEPSQFWDEIDAGPASYAEVFSVVHRLHAESVEKPRWCDQLGLVEAYAAPIFEAFPRAKMIHMVRDPRCELFASQRPGRVGWTLGKWLTSVQLAGDNARRYDGGYLVVRQEDFESDEAQTLADICAFLGEPFDEGLARRATSRRHIPPARSRANQRFIERKAGMLMTSQGYPIVDGSRTATVREGFLDEPANRLALTTWQRLKERSIVRQLGGSR